MPKLKNITPRYDQQYFEPLERLNKFQVLVSPDHLKEEGVKINQNAWFTRIDADNDLEETYTLNQRGNGVYLFLLEGKVAVGDQILDSRDALGVENVEEINLKLSKGAQLLIMEVPMS